MAKVGQISIARPGLPLQLEFDEGEIKDVIEENAQPGDHVTLYPGDYTDWHNREGNEAYDKDTPIVIPEGVGVTILPGAKVEYGDDFRIEDFDYDGDTFDSETHPLSNSDRYKYPNFQGFIENIADTNLASEWGFETDVEGLRTQVKDLLERGTTIEVAVGDQSNPPELGLNRQLKFLEDDLIDITASPILDEDGNPTESVEVDFTFSGEPIVEVDGGRNINVESSDGGTETVNHDVINPDADGNPSGPSGSQQNTGAKFVQSLQFENGHVIDVEANNVATINDREPRGTDGEDGDIWLTKNRDFLLDLFLSKQQPSPADGEEGDIWMVDDQFDQESRKAGDFYISSTGDPETNYSDEGEDGSVWFYVNDWDGTDFEIKEIEEITYNPQSPTSADGNGGEVYATNEKDV